LFCHVKGIKCADDVRAYGPEEYIWLVEGVGNRGLRTNRLVSALVILLHKN